MLVLIAALAGGTAATVWLGQPIPKAETEMPQQNAPAKSPTTWPTR